MKMENNLACKPIRLCLGKLAFEKLDVQPRVHYLYSIEQSLDGIIALGNIEKTKKGEFLSVYEISTRDFSVQDKGEYLEITPYHFENQIGKIDSREITSVGRRLVDALKVLEETENE